VLNVIVLNVIMLNVIMPNAVVLLENYRKIIVRTFVNIAARACKHNRLVMDRLRNKLKVFVTVSRLHYYHNMFIFRVSKILSVL
jgi:hypothetical protein